MWRTQRAIFGRQSNEPFFGLKFLLKTRLWSESPEPLIGFLAYLEPKLWLKNKNWGKFQVLQKAILAISPEGHNSPAD